MVVSEMMVLGSLLVEDAMLKWLMVATPKSSCVPHPNGPKRLITMGAQVRASGEDGTVNELSESCRYILTLL